MKCEIRKVPEMEIGLNREFFIALVNTINEAKDFEDLKERMYLLFSYKIKLHNIFWDYGWTNKGLSVWYGSTANEILVAECDTSEYLEK